MAVLSPETLLYVNQCGVYIFRLDPTIRAMSPDWFTPTERQAPIWQYPYFGWWSFGARVITPHTPFGAEGGDMSVSVQYNGRLLRVERLSGAYQCQSLLTEWEWLKGNQSISVGRHRSVFSAFDQETQAWRLCCYSHLQLSSESMKERKLEGAWCKVDCTGHPRPSTARALASFDETSGRLAVIFNTAVIKEMSHPALKYTVTFP